MKADVLECNVVECTEQAVTADVHLESTRTLIGFRSASQISSSRKAGPVQAHRNLNHTIFNGPLELHFDVLSTHVPKNATP